MVECKNDQKLITRIRGVCLFSAEAHYHQSCRKEYTREPGLGRSAESEQRERQYELERAHELAFKKVCSLVEERVVPQKEVMKLSDLCKYYSGVLEGTKFPNSHYRSEKLRAKFQKHEIGTKISFTSDKGEPSSVLVYSNSLATSDAIKHAFKLGTEDSIANVAKFLRHAIKSSLDRSEKLPWPPTAEYLLCLDDILPKDLEKFLKIVLYGDEDTENVRVNMLVFSIRQDICRAATNGGWSMPKHVLLCMTLRHMFRSKELLTLLNKFGHCESYSYSLELETAIVKAVQDSASVLPPSIVRKPKGPSVFHSESDNFDAIVNELYGPGSIHTAHGIMLQEVESDEEAAGETTSVPRTKQRSLDKVSHDSLAECYMNVRKSSNMVVQEERNPEGVQAVERSSVKNVLWIFLRETNVKMPGWGGWISVTGDPPHHLTTIGYYPVIHHPITEYDTVKECLRLAEEGTAEVGQEYVIVTADLGVCMKAYPLIWNHPERYKKHLILIGTFHLTCAYFHMIGKRMDSSGLTDVLPTQWTISMIIPIPKQDSDQLRPISLTSCMCKVLERIILNRLKYIIGNKLHRKLYGFLQGRSTRDCFADYFSSTTSTTVTTFVDLKAAFDKANKTIILERLTEFGIKGKMLNWIKGYLSNRQAKVYYGGHLTDRTVEMELGTPQGGVLSPFLFNILMDKLISKISLKPTDNIICYADDICLRSQSVEDMQDLVTQLYEATLECGLVISVPKTKILYPLNNNCNSVVTIQDVPLTSCIDYKYLGVTTPPPCNYIGQLRDRMAHRLRPL